MVRYSGITCSQARQICEEQGAKPADIHSEEHYYMLLGYLRMIASRDAYVQASIGLTYNSKVSPLWTWGIGISIVRQLHMNIVLLGLMLMLMSLFKCS